MLHQGFHLSESMSGFGTHTSRIWVWSTTIRVTRISTTISSISTTSSTTTSTVSSTYIAMYALIGASDEATTASRKDLSFRDNECYKYAVARVCRVVPRCWYVYRYIYVCIYVYICISIIPRFDHRPQSPEGDFFYRVQQPSGAFSHAHALCLPFLFFPPGKIGRGVFASRRRNSPGGLAERAVV